MKLLANENFPLISVNALRNNGYDVISITELSPGISDVKVMNWAIESNRTILTFDKDYGELVFKKNFRPSQGIIYFRWNTVQSDELSNYCLSLLSNRSISFNYTLTVIDDDGDIRQKRY